MSTNQISAIQSVVLTLLAALVAGGTIAADMSDTVTAVIVAVFTAVGAFLVHPVARQPRD